MCGFVGYIGGGETQTMAPVLHAMADRIRHRGPDDADYYMDGDIALGFRRLSIIDLEGGRQPILNEDKSKVLMFNGEIYNYQSIREELVKAGIKGTTYTDNLGSAEEMAVRYKLVAVNAAGESMTAAECGPVNAGSPAALPFKESFAGCVYAHKGWSTATTQDPDGYVYEAWELKHTGTMYHFPTDEDLSINPQDGDGGFAACLFYGYCEEGQTESLISPNMAVEGVKAVDLKFWLYEVEDDASGNILNVSVSYDGGEWQQVYTHEPPADGAPQWREITVPVTVKEGCGKLRLKFDAVRMGLMYTDVMIDNITVEKSTSSAIEGVVTDGADAQAPAEYFTLSGVRVSKPVAPGTYIVSRGNDVKKIMIK